MYYTQLFVHFLLTFLVCAILNVTVEEFIFTSICQFYQYKKEKEHKKELFKSARTFVGKLARLPGAYLPKVRHLAGYGFAVLKLAIGAAIVFFLFVYLYNLWHTLKTKQNRTSESDCSIFMVVSVGVFVGFGVFCLLASLKAQLNYRANSKIYERFHADYAAMVDTLRASKSSLQGDVNRLAAHMSVIHSPGGSEAAGLFGQFKRRLQILPVAKSNTLQIEDIVRQEELNVNRTLKSIAKLKLFYHLKQLNYKWSCGCSFAAALLTLVLVLLRFCSCCYLTCVRFRPSKECFLRCYNFGSDIVSGMPIAPFRLFR